MGERLLKTCLHGPRDRVRECTHVRCELHASVHARPARIGVCHVAVTLLKAVKASCVSSRLTSAFGFIPSYSLSFWTDFLIKMSRIRGQTIFRVFTRFLFRQLPPGQILCLLGLPPPQEHRPPEQ